MGEYAEMVLEGILCEECGGIVGDIPKSVGHPRKCAYCKDSDKKEKHVNVYVTSQNTKCLNCANNFTVLCMNCNVKYTTTAHNNYVSLGTIQTTASTTYLRQFTVTAQPLITVSRSNQSYGSCLCAKCHNLDLCVSDNWTVTCTRDGQTCDKFISKIKYKCYIPNCEPYPQCTGNGSEKCLKCSLYADRDNDGGCD